MHKLIKVLSPILTILLIVCLAFIMKDLTLKQLLSYVPSNLFLAFLALMGLYALKSLSVVFPLSILYLMAGVMYPRWAAVIINFAGLFVSISLPYWIGRERGTSFVDGLTLKYPKLDHLLKMGISNDILLSYLMRIVGVLPGDLCSLFLGSCRMRYSRYLLGSLLGFAPVMIIHVLLADVISASVDIGVRQALTPEVILFSVCLVVVSIVSTLAFHKRARRQRY